MNVQDLLLCLPRIMGGHGMSEVEGSWVRESPVPKSGSKVPDSGRRLTVPHRLLSFFVFVFEKMIYNMKVMSDFY